MMEQLFLENVCNNRLLALQSIRYDILNARVFREWKQKTSHHFPEVDEHGPQDRTDWQKHNKESVIEVE